MASSPEHPAATCRGCGGSTKDTLVYCDDCYRKGGRTDFAARKSGARYGIAGVRVSRRLFWWWQRVRYGWPGEAA